MMKRFATQRGANAEVATVTKILRRHISKETSFPSHFNRSAPFFLFGLFSFLYRFQYLVSRPSLHCCILLFLVGRVVLPVASAWTLKQYFLGGLVRGSAPEFTENLSCAA